MTQLALFLVFFFGFSIRYLTTKKALNLSSLLPLSTMLAANAVTIGASVAGDASKYVGMYGEVFVIIGERFAKFNAAAAFLGILIAFVAFAEKVRNHNQSNGALGLALLVLIVALTGLSAGTGAPKLAVILALALILASSANSLESYAHGIFLVWVLIVSSSVLVMLSHPDIAVGVCRVDKCGLGGSLLYGSLLNENALACQLVIALPWARKSIQSMKGKLLISVVSALLVLAAGSRSAVAAMAVYFIALTVRSAAQSLIESLFTIHRSFSSY